MLSDFIQWTKLVDKDYTLHDFYNRTNTFTFNYGTAAFTPMANLMPDFGEVYIDMHLTQTDLIHTHGKCLDLQLNLLGGTHNMGQHHIQKII